MSDWNADYPDTQTEQLIANMQVRGTYSFSPQAMRTTRVLPGHREWYWPKYRVTERLTASAEDMSGAAILIFDLCRYASQPKKGCHNVHR